MGTSTRGSSAWRRPYHVARDGVLLGRLRWCIGLTLLGVLVAVLGIVVERPVGLGRRLEFSLKFAAACLAAWELARSRTARAHARTLALGYVAVLVGLITATLHARAHEAAVGPTSFVALMTGTALLLPWGWVPQAVTCTLAVGAYAWLVLVHSVPVGSAAMTSVLMAVPVALVGARLLDEYHAASFERGWQQRELVALARQLAQASEPEAVIAKVLAHARRLLAVDSAAFSTYEPSERVFRVAGLDTGHRGPRHWMEGLEIPEDFPVVRDILARGTFAVPDDDPETAIRPVLEQHGARHVLYLALRCGGDLVGILGLVRNDDVAFARGERRLARGLADQAALAMRSARMVADLRRANRLKAEFVATMSHELRTPLTVILGFAEMARDRGVGTAEREEFLDRIEGAGRDLLTLIETTLEIGKIEAGRDEVQLQPVPLPAFWAGVGDACARLPRSADVRLDWDGDAPGIALVTDPRKLTVVVRNLVGNALKFTQQGFVRAELRLAGDRVVLRVRDTGIGIRPEDHATVFEMFRQADGSASRRYEGTGLGLYVVQRFVQQLGGTIELESAPGEGSVFTVTLPQATDAPPFERAA